MMEMDKKPTANSVYVAIAGEGSGKSKVCAFNKHCAKRTGNCF